MEFKQFFGQKRTKTVINNGLSENNNDETKDERTEPGTVMVSNLLDNVTEKQLQQLFEEFGLIQRVKVVRTKDFATKEWVGNGTAFITFWDKDDAKKALKHNGLLWNYTRLIVQRSQNR